MDSLKNQDGAMMKIWRVAFGGDEATGMTKLVVILAAFVLIFGSFFALVGA